MFKFYLVRITADRLQGTDSLRRLESVIVHFSSVD